MDHSAAPTPKAEPLRPGDLVLGQLRSTLRILFLLGGQSLVQSLYKAVFTEYLQALVTHLKRLKPRKWEDHRGQVETDFQELHEAFGRQEVSPGPSGVPRGRLPLSGVSLFSPDRPGPAVPSWPICARLVSQGGPGALGRGEAGPGGAPWGTQGVTRAGTPCSPRQGRPGGLCSDPGVRPVLGEAGSSSPQGLGDGAPGQEAFMEVFQLSGKQGNPCLDEWLDSFRDRFPDYVR